MTIKDLKRIRQAKVTTKNTMAWVFFFSFVPALVIVSLVFLVLYVSHSDVTMNDTVISYGDQTYESIFRNFFLIMALIISAILLIFLVANRHLPSSVAWLSSSLDDDLVVYAENRRHSVWISMELMIVYDQRSGLVRTETNLESIRNGLHRTIFFLNDGLNELPKRSNDQKLVLRIDEPARYSTYQTTYTIKSVNYKTEYRFSERRVQRSHGRVRLLGSNRGTITEIGATPSFTIHPAIRAELVKQSVID